MLLLLHMVIIHGNRLEFPYFVLVCRTQFHIFLIFLFLIRLTLNITFMIEFVWILCFENL